MSQPTATTNHVTKSVKALMGVKGTNQDDLGAVIGVCQSSLSKRLSGKIDWTVSEVEAICAFYNVSIAEVITGTLRLDSVRYVDDAGLTTFALAT